MKQDNLRHSLKWRIYSFIVLFVIIIMIILWLFQIVLIEPFYRELKLREIQTFSDTTVLNLKNKTDDVQIMNYVEVIQSFDKDSEHINFFIVKEKFGKLFLLESRYNALKTSFVLDGNNVVNIWNKAKEGEYNSFFFSSHEADSYNLHDPEDIRFRLGDELFYCQFYKDKDNNNNMLILSCYLQPLSAAKNTLKYQFIIITMILVLLAISFAMMASSYICKPLEDLTASAKKLSKDINELSFNGEGYQEVVDLSNALNYALKEIKKTDTLQKDLISNVSHELRTPLTLIAGYSEMMRDIPSEQNEKNFNIIINETKRLSNLVNDILTLSKLQSVENDSNMEKVSLNSIIEEVLQAFNLTAKEKNFKFTFNCEFNYYIFGNEMQLSQVIYNFIGNAVNYNKDILDEKEIIVSIEEINNELLVKVKDFGIGIKEEELENIWQRYYKVYDSNKVSTIGSGLGLPIVRQILDSHSFRHGVNSTYGEGSEFYFIVPKDKILQISDVKDEDNYEENK